MAAGCHPNGPPTASGAVAVHVRIVRDAELTLPCHDLHPLRRPDRHGGVMFLMNMGVSGAVHHRGDRIILNRGEAALFNCSDMADARWCDARALVARLPGAQAPAAGRRLGSDVPLLRLLRSYLRGCWREATVSGALPAIAERQIGELVAALCTGGEAESSPHGADAARTARGAALREVIARRYADPCLSMRDVAASVGLSERAGYLAFEALGLSFSHELQAIRLDRAREMLLAGSGRVMDVAYSVGFSDLSHFHRLFRRRFGCTPGEVRLVSASGSGASPAASDVPVAVPCSA